VSVAVPRNHSKVGCYVRVAVQGWRANCDFQLIVDHKALAEYICKYATKPEKETTTFQSGQMRCEVRCEVRCDVRCGETCEV
jgi:hypothetical protein